jgi:hypothetical protein
MTNSPASRLQIPGTPAKTNCCCGLNTITNLPVPSADKSDGPAVNVSGLQGQKTIELSGTYAGSYWIYGSHDGNLFFPVANFDSGGGSQTVRKTLEVAANFMKVHREAPQSGLVTVNLAARATVPCATSGQSGANNFFNLATLVPGMIGPQAPLDLFTLVATTGLDVSNVACSGSFTGQISIEGSLDGTNFSPVGSFLSSQAQKGSGPGQLMFDPVVVGQIIRFLRVNILPSTVISGPTSLTLGGPQNCDCKACNHCASFNFNNGPYISTIRSGNDNARILDVMDLAFLDLSCFTPGNPLYFSASITFQTPPGWIQFVSQGSAALYLGGNPAPIGTLSPPAPFGDIGAGADGGFANVSVLDPGPANATPTFNLPPTTVGVVPAIPSSAVPLKLVLSSLKNTIVPAHSFFTEVLSATFNTCDHLFG